MACQSIVKTRDVLPSTQEHIANSVFFRLFSLMTGLYRDEGANLGQFTPLKPYSQIVYRF